jgi:hypothetical protein
VDVLPARAPRAERPDRVPASCATIMSDAGCRSGVMP